MVRNRAAISGGRWSLGKAAGFRFWAFSRPREGDFSREGGSFLGDLGLLLKGKACRAGEKGEKNKKSWACQPENSDV
jgi:hypothetical protein